MHISTWKESFLLKGSCVSKLFSFRSITISFCFSKSIWGQSKSIWFSSSLHLGHPNLSDLISAKNSANKSINKTRTKPYLPFLALLGGRYTKKPFIKLHSELPSKLNCPSPSSSASLIILSICSSVCFELRLLMNFFSSSGVKLPSLSPSKPLNCSFNLAGSFSARAYTQCTD